MKTTLQNLKKRLLITGLAIVAFMGVQAQCSTSTAIAYQSPGNYSYDNKPSPFYILQIPYPVLDGYLTYSYVQKNNIIESWFTTPGDGFINTYTYRSDGYPIIVRSFEVADPTNSWKGLLFYK